MSKTDQRCFHFRVRNGLLHALAFCLVVAPACLCSAQEKPPRSALEFLFRFAISCDISIDVKDRIATVESLNFGNEGCFDWGYQTEEVLSHLSSLGPITDLKILEWSGFQCSEIVDLPNIRDHVRILRVGLFGDQNWDACPKLEKLEALTIGTGLGAGAGNDADLSKCCTVILGNAPGVESLTFEELDLTKLDLIDLLQKHQIKNLRIKSCKISNDTIAAFVETGLETLEVELWESELENVDAVKKLRQAKKLKVITLRLMESANQKAFRRTRTFSKETDSDSLEIRTNDLAAAFGNTRSPERVADLNITGDGRKTPYDRNENTPLSPKDLRRFRHLTRLSLYSLSFEGATNGRSLTFPKLVELEVYEIANCVECIDFFLNSGSLKKLTLEEEDALKILSEVSWPLDAKNRLLVRFSPWFDDEERLSLIEIKKILLASRSIKTLSLRVVSTDYQLVQRLLVSLETESDVEK